MLIEIEDLKQHIDLNTNEYDDILDIYIEAISDFIKEYLGKCIEVDEIEEILNGDDLGYSFQLANYPIIIDDDNTFLFQYRTGTNSEPVWNDFDFDNYQVDQESGIVEIDQMFGGRRNIKVSYTAGYESIPTPIKLAAIKLIAKVFNSRRSDGFKDESLGDASISWDKFLSDDIVALLSKYKKLSL